MAGESNRGTTQQLRGFLGIFKKEIKLPMVAFAGKVSSLFQRVCLEA
jgi:hypothetical protein